MDAFLDLLSARNAIHRVQEDVTKGVRSPFRSLFGQRVHKTEVTESRIYMSPIGTPEYNSAIYSVSIYALSMFREGTVPTVEVPIKQLISTERSLFSAFRNLATGMDKMIRKDLDSPDTTANNAYTAKTATTSLRHHVTDAGMFC